MEEKSSSASSTPSAGAGYWKMGTAADDPVVREDTPGVPSPVLPSELMYNDQSTILDSSMGDCSTTVMYDPKQDENTILQGMSADTTTESPVCSRTRSHDGSLTMLTNYRTSIEMDQLRQELENNISKNEAIPDNKDEDIYTMTTEGLEIIENTGKKEIYQHGYTTEIAQTKKLLKGLTNLQASNRDMGALLKEELEKEEGTEKLKIISNNLILQAEDYPKPPEKHEIKIEDLEEALSMTHISRPLEIKQALNDTLDALESMEEVDLKKLPLDILESLVKVLLKYSTQCNVKLKSDSSLLCQMTNEMFGLVGVHEKLGAVSSYNTELLRNWNEVLDENEEKNKKIKELEAEQINSTTGSVDMKMKKNLDIQNREVERLKKVVRDNRVIEEQNTRTLEYQVKKIDELERKLEAERSLNKVPSDSLEKLSRSHNREVNSVKSMFSALITSKDETIKKLEDINSCKVRDVRKLYEDNEEKEKKITKLEKKIQKIEKDVKTEKDEVIKLTNKVEEREIEINRYEKLLNNAKAKKVKLEEDIQVITRKYDQQTTRLEMLERSVKTIDRNKEKKRKMVTSEILTAEGQNETGHREVGTIPKVLKFKDSSHSKRSDSRDSGSESDNSMRSKALRARINAKEVQIRPPPPTPISPHLSTDLPDLNNSSSERMEEDQTFTLTTFTPLNSANSDTDSGNEKRKKKDKEVFKTPYPLESGKERRSKERQLKLENQKLTEQLKTISRDNEERDKMDEERKKREEERYRLTEDTVRKSSDMVKDNQLTILELQNTHNELKRMILDKEQEIANLAATRVGPQEETWMRLIRLYETQTVQLEDVYTYKADKDGVLKHPHHLRMKQDLASWHPPMSNLCLEWTLTGNWFPIPKGKNDTNTTYYNYWVVRVESYITEKGEVKRAFSYGDCNLSITIWYKVEEFMEVANWIIPERSQWANTKVWDRDSRPEGSNTNAVRTRPYDFQVSSNYRGSAPRNMRARPPLQRGNGRVGRSQQYYRDSYQSSNWSPERQSSGVGRSSRGARRDSPDTSRGARRISPDNHREKQEYRDNGRESRKDSSERTGQRDVNQRGPRINSPDRTKYRGSRTNSPDRSNQRDNREPRDQRRYRDDSRGKTTDQRNKRDQDTRYNGNYTDDSSGRDTRRGEGRRDYEKGNYNSYRNT